MNNAIKCKYCNLKIYTLLLDELSNFDICVYYCNFCKVEFCYFINKNKMASTSFYSKINSKYYRLTIPVVGQYQLWHIKDSNDLHTRKYHKINLILSLEEKPNINPQNINEKIKNWITFV